MELNNSVSKLYNFAASGNAFQPQETLAGKEAGVRSGFLKTAYFGSSSQANHIADLAQRVERMAGELTRLQQSSPTLSDASTVSVERAREGTESFSYSVTRDEAGAITEEFTFTVRYKPAGETAFTEVSGAPKPVNSEVIGETPVADPVVETGAAETEKVETAPDNLQRTVDNLLSEAKLFNERIAQLIEYYRIKTGDVAAPEESAPAAPAAPATPVALKGDQGAPRETASVEVAEQSGESINIESDRVSRVYSGDGDDAVAINAAQVTRVRTGEGDDSLDINADKVARVRSGGGDDTLNIDADKVRRVNTGEGDDIVNINTDKATRINTGNGDDELSINADTITRVNTGDGDDVLNLTADTIKRVNAGAGDDIITLDAEDAAIGFGKGGGEDTISIKSVGALAIQIDSALATSSDDMMVSKDGDNVVLKFASGESLTINNISNADMISVRIGGEAVDLHVSDAPLELDMSA